MVAAAGALHHRARARSPRHDPRRHGRRYARRSDRPAHGARLQRAGVRRPDARDRNGRWRDDARRVPVSRRARTGRGDAECRGARLGVRAEKTAPLRRDADNRLHPARRHARGAVRRPGAAALRLARAVRHRRPGPAARCRRAFQASARVAAISSRSGANAGRSSSRCCAGSVRTSARIPRSWFRPQRSQACNSRASIRELFAPALRRDTLGLCQRRSSSACSPTTSASTGSSRC